MGDPTLYAALGDHSQASRYHIVTDDGDLLLGACILKPLNIDTVTPATQVPAEARCRLYGCRLRWP